MEYRDVLDYSHDKECASHTHFITLKFVWYARTPRYAELETIS